MVGVDPSVVTPDVNLSTKMFFTLLIQSDQVFSFGHVAPDKGHLIVTKTLF